MSQSMGPTTHFTPRHLLRRRLLAPETDALLDVQFREVELKRGARGLAGQRGSRGAGKRRAQEALTGRGRCRLPPRSARACFGGAYPRTRPGCSCRARRFARRWLRSPAKALSCLPTGVRCPALLPIAGCSLAAHTLRSRDGCGSGRRPGLRRPAAGTQGRSRLAPEDRPTRLLLARSPLDAVQDAPSRHKGERV